MNQSELYDYLKLRLDKMKAKTLSEILQQDRQYLEANEKHHQAEKEYSSLKLSEEQRNTIDNLLQWADICHMEYGTLSYMAGLIDNQEILDCLGGLSTDIKSKHILEQLYYDEIQFGEDMKESEELKEFWNRMRKNENIFAEKLTDCLKEDFNEILETRMMSLTKYTQEDFIYGFQMGARMIIGIYTNYHEKK